MDIAVLGGGSWATAIVKILTTNHDRIYWWVRETEIKESIENGGFNALYLRYCELDNRKIVISNDIHEIIAKADVLFFVIPAAFVEISLMDVTKEELNSKKIVSAIKGIVPSCNKIVSDWLKDNYEVPLNSLAVISGPSHAEEIAAERLTYLTCGSHDENFAKQVSEIITCKFVQTTISDDVEGIEYGAVMKNIYALASGIAKGMGYGDNFIAVLIAGAIQEMEIFLNKIKPRQRDVKRLAYLGDLLVTAYSQHSRNRTFGQMIGQGYSVQSAQLEMKMIAEGYYSAKCIHEANKQCYCNLPIAEAVYNVLYCGKDRREEFLLLIETFK